jgi:arabinan endo-1,5-alpha-L-arabinosidase
MPIGHTRRQFLRSGLLLSAGLLGVGKGYSSLMKAQEQLPDDDHFVQLELTGAIRQVHDPAIIKDGDTYYLFCTHGGIYVRKSANLLDWERPFPPSVFPPTNAPHWTQEMVPGSNNDIWAPDISYYNGKFHLYYAVSTFGSNRSVIGLATNTTLDSKSGDFEWVDQGLVIESTYSDDYNCIDPNLIIDAGGFPWLAFGSFWSGIKLRRLDYRTGKLSPEDDRLYSLASRAIPPRAVEAPFIIRKGGYYYLFVSFDACCRGVDSTYNVRVGRSEAVTGPYIDHDGVGMLEGGGTQVTFPTKRWRGPGHNAILQEPDTDYIVYHAYDADHMGVETLRIAPLVWDEDGWPSLRTQEENT